MNKVFISLLLCIAAGSYVYAMEQTKSKELELHGPLEGGDELVKAIINGNSVKVGQLLKSKEFDLDAPVYDNGRTYLMIAADYGMDYIVKQLVDAGADIDTQDKFGLTALSHAVRIVKYVYPQHGNRKNQKEKIVTNLIEKGADQTLGTDTKTSPYHFASKGDTVLPRAFWEEVLKNPSN